MRVLVLTTKDAVITCVLQAMLAEFARQIEEEKRAKEAESKAKAAAYQEMLKGNAKELERKKAIKQAEMAENHRLFELQIEMAEKQVQISCHFLHERKDAGLLLFFARQRIVEPWAIHVLTC